MSVTTSNIDLSRSELTSLRAAISAQAPVPAGPVPLVDRLAMRAGLALIVWSRSRGTGPARRRSSQEQAWRAVRPIRQQRPFC